MLYSLFASFQQNEHGVCQNYYECMDFDIYCFVLFWCSPVTWAHERLLGFAPKSFDMTLMVFRSFLAFWSDKMLLAWLLWPVSFSVQTQPFLQESCLLCWENGTLRPLVVFGVFTTAVVLFPLGIFSCYHQKIGSLFA